MINPWDIPPGGVASAANSNPPQAPSPGGGGKRGAGSIPGLLRAVFFSPLLIPVALAVVVAIPLGSVAMVLANAAGACFRLFDRLARPEQAQADDVYAAASGGGKVVVLRPKCDVVPLHVVQHKLVGCPKQGGKCANDTTPLGGGAA